MFIRHHASDVIDGGKWHAITGRRDYRRTTSASQLISELGWQSLAERRKTSRLTLLYNATNGLVAIPMDELEHRLHQD